MTLDGIYALPGKAASGTVKATRALRQGVRDLRTPPTAVANLVPTRIFYGVSFVQARRGAGVQKRGGGPFDRRERGGMG